MTGTFLKIISLMALLILGQAEHEQPAPPESSSTSEPPQSWSEIVPSPDEVERSLIDEIEPLDKGARGGTEPGMHTTNREEPTGAAHGAPGGVSMERGVLGVAPGQEQPKLRREGEFVVNRRGRVVPSPNGRDTLFAFEADSDTASEPPMVLSPCQTLQNMEDIVRERGDKIVFILSGQVLVYRGVNYLLPTMMKLAIDRGNLEQ